MAYEFYARQFLDLVMAVERHGEQKFIVFSAVKGGGDEIHAEFFGHDGSLIVDGDAVFVDAASGVALLADVEQFGTESVTDVHHCGGHDSGFGQLYDDVAPSFGFELSLYEILLAFELRDEVRAACRGGFFAFKELEAHVGGSEIA